MPEYLKQYGNTLGPLGVPCSDEQAFALDALLKQLPPDDQAVKKATVAPALLSLEAGERADVSWITTEATDRYREVVIARGMRDDHYKLNPLVTLGHSYWMPPVGRSLWRKQAANEATGLKGVLAKTLYPTRPESWPADRGWEPDDCLALIQAGLLAGKSIGFIATKRRSPTDDDVKADPRMALVRSIVEEWQLIEYAVCPLPVNPLTVVQTVSKSFASAAGLRLPTAPTPPTNQPNVSPLDAIAFTPLSVIQSAVEESARGADPRAVAAKAVADAIDRHKGRV